MAWRRSMVYIVALTRLLVRTSLWAFIGQIHIIILRFNAEEDSHRIRAFFLRGKIYTS
jgi:hypothetical protein